MIKPNKPLPYFSISLVSAAALGYEVLLMRLYSIIQWHHFAYMIISLALLGYGVSGALLTLLQKSLLRHFSFAYIANICLFGMSAVACFLIVQKLPFNTEEVLWDLRQNLWLMANYLLLAVPFFFAANAIGLALRHYRHHITGIYAADLFGAGLGSLGILGLLFILFPMQALKAIGLLGLVAAMAATWELRRQHSSIFIGLVTIAVSIVSLPASWTQLEVSPYKSLSQSLRIKDARVVDQLSSPLGLLSIVESPLIPLRYAPGLSLNATTEPPAQLGVFTDADSLSVINSYSGNTQTLAYLDQLTSALAYHLQPVQRVMILGTGGGSDVLQALYHHAPAIDAVELNPQFARLVSKDYADFSGHLYQQPGVELHITEARSFVENSKHQYDLIQVSLLDTFGASSAGHYALSANYLYTVEAVSKMLGKLVPGGYISLSRWTKLPPRDTLKLFATGLEALKRNNISQPGQHLALIRSWQTSTLLIKNGILTPQDINKLKTFCRDRSFDTVYYPGIQQSESNRFNQLQDNWFYLGSQALLGNEQRNFIDNYKFNLQPPTDDRPYFFHFFKWKTLPEIFHLRGRGGIPLADSSYLVLFATLIQAIVASLVLIFLPIWIYRRRQTVSQHLINRYRVIAYFFSLGVGFLFIEIAMIQKMMLFLHHPLYSIAVVLTSFLIFSGLGSAWSERLQTASTPVSPCTILGVPISGILLLGTVYLFILGPLFHLLSALPDPLRILAAIVLIAPLGFCMGMPFPLGLAQLAKHEPGLIPWAWAINGCASVISAVLANLLAIHLGVSTIIVLALGMYAASPLIFPAPIQARPEDTYGFK